MSFPCSNPLTASYLRVKTKVFTRVVLYLLWCPVIALTSCLLLSSLFIHFTHCTPYCSQNAAGTIPPQGLILLFPIPGVLISTCLASYSLQVFVQMLPSLWDLTWPIIQNCNILSPALSIPFMCFIFLQDFYYLLICHLIYFIHCLPLPIRL